MTTALVSKLPPRATPLELSALLLACRGCLPVPSRNVVTADLMAFDPTCGRFVAVVTAKRAERFTVLMDLLNDAVAAILCRSGLIAFELQTWERRGGSDLCEVVPVGAEDFPEG